MSVNIARFYRRERLQFDCDIVTPMFLGNSKQEAELRAAPFKGLLRYWWRVANGSNYAGYKELLAAENKVFGSADEKNGGKSLVTVKVEDISGMRPQKDNFKNPGNVAHPECEKSNHQTNPLNYLAGMGLIHYRNGILHSYFPVGASFRLQMDIDARVVREVSAALGVFAGFAAIGSRSRNAWGSLQIGRTSSSTIKPTHWDTAMQKEYPHCLGQDSKGDLLWKTKNPQADWKLCMRDLADAYIKVRTKLNVVSGTPPERHLLGYPITNHDYGSWGRQGRHGSALRLIVRREGNLHRGYILHLPHAFSKKMWSGGPERQIGIWRKVHADLDKLCSRAKYEEVLS